MSDRRSHWEDVYERRAPTDLSWYQPDHGVSLSLIADLGVQADVPVLDVGGGASTLVDALLDRGFSDVTVLDLSQRALEAARVRVGPQPGVRWLNEDLMAWQPARSYGLWHDRAVFHFLTEPSDVRRYLIALDRALADDGCLAIGTFAADGPDRCSGLPVARYDPGELSGVLGTGFDVVATRREEHRTPGGAVQPFSWVAARR